MEWAKNRMIFNWGIALFVFWMGVSGKFKAHEVMLAVLVVTGAVVVLVKAMPMKVPDGKKASKGLAGIKNTFLYILYMLKDIFFANLHVASIVLSPKLRINPGMVEYRHGFKERFAGFLYANSITLTPGTLTVLMDRENITVHLLEIEHESGLRDWKVAGLIGRMEDGK